MTVGADYLGISVITLRRYVRAGRIQAYRFGERIVRVDLGELDQMMAASATAGEPNV